MTPMKPKNIHLPEAMWGELQAVAVELGSREGKPVSVSEAIRRILAKHLSRRVA